MIEVTAAVIRDNGKFLICQRPKGKNCELLWEFPGGKVQENETEELAIEREIKEEFEMDIKVIRFLTNNVCEYPKKTIDLRLYECKFLAGEFHLHDHSEYQFVDRKEIIKFDLCPADIPLAKYIIESEK